MDLAYAPQPSTGSQCAENRTAPGAAGLKQSRLGKGHHVLADDQVIE